MESCCMSIINIVSIFVAVMAMFVAIYIAQMTSKVQFLLKCRADWTAAVTKRDLENYEELRNYALEQISYLGDDFKKYADEYKEAKKSKNLDSTKIVLEKLTNCLTRRLKNTKNTSRSNHVILPPIS